MIILLLLLELLILIAVGNFLVFFCVIPLFIGAPYVKSKKERVKTMMRLADLKPSDLVIDLGSGDGLFVIEAARHGAKAVGYEINPFLVWWSRRKIKSLRLAERAKIYHKNFWRANLSPATCVMLYGITGMMEKLEKKLERELKLGTKIISNGFSFPHWKVKIQENGVYLYVKE